MRPIINSDLIGETLTVELPGFPTVGEAKKEPCQLHYIEEGEGEPLLLVHSIGQSIYTWRELMPLLIGRYRVIAVDLPGFGFSGRPVSLNYSMDEMAECILSFMDALHLEWVHALGASLGSVYLLRAMTKAPDRFEKVMALCPGGVTKQMPGKIRRMALPFIGPFVRESYGKGSFRKALAGCYYDSTVCNKEVLNQYYKTCDDYASRQAIMYCLRNFDFPLVLEGLKNCDHEVFVIWGEEDKYQPFSNIDILREVLENGVFYSVRNAGHYFQEEKADILADMVIKYIEYQ